MAIGWPEAPEANWLDQLLAPLGTEMKNHPKNATILKCLRVQMAQLKTIAHGLGIMYLLSSGQICQQEIWANRPVNLPELLTSGSAMLTSGHREGS